MKKTRQRKAPKEVKHINNLTVRLSEKELEALNSYAEKNGLTKGEVLRKVLDATLKE